ncbi:MAG: hydroxymyristoyl-ACP dehydratase [Bacteroidales bacterium]|nr:hydroxymyristoyl-ACP dehydratase [Bacteroidales bacterium]
MPTFPIHAQDYIPQRPPIVMIDNILNSEEDTFITDLLIRPDNIFVENGILRETGLMENIAQTSAARVGFSSAGAHVPIGVIGGISHFDLHFLPKVGRTLVTTIHVVAGVANALVVDATVTCEEQLVATCSMKVFITQ